MKTCGTVVAGLAAVVIAVCTAAAETPAVTRAQIEADWLRQDELRNGPAAAVAAASTVKPEEDAPGGCDGVKNGKWGFHTENEERPWWQVDLGQTTAVDRLLLYNRCDSGMAARNARLIALVSEDGQQFTQVWQNDGQVFLGHTDQKPLEAKLAGAKARFLRLQLPGKSYFHLDEVEVYAVGGEKNVALGRPATQSSVSQWSVAHRRGDVARLNGTVAAPPIEYPTAQVIERGLKLAEDLTLAGVEVRAETDALRAMQSQLEQQSDGQRGQSPERPSADAARTRYVQARWTVRKLALKNPLLNFDSILFCKAAPGRFPHMSDQFYGWWSRPGGGIFLLEQWKSEQPRLRCLTGDFATGSFLRPDLSYDGRQVLFAYCKFYEHVPDLKNKADKANLPEDAFYHIFALDLGDGRVRQLTRGKYDDFDARWLPDGGIVFLSTRKGQFLQCAKSNTQQTSTGDLPDSYVRCGGDNYRPVPVFTLHAMDGDGGNLRPISAFENFEWTPSVANDGRILYTRWDYIDRFNGHFFSLWSTNPDGTNPQLVYGNYTVRPQVVLEARAIPNSTKLIFTASAHHSITGGSLVLFDRERGTEEAAPLVRLTPEVPFPETERNGPCYYANPWPLSESHCLTAWNDRPLPPHCRVDESDRNPMNSSGIYLYDAFGNLNLIYRDAEISSHNPIPVGPRPKPPAYSGVVDWNGAQEGRFLVQDVYRGLPEVARGSIQRLRIVGVPPKVQPHMNNPVLGVSREDPGKFVLGTVPVEPDGSAAFRVPSGVSLLFQALDADGLAVQTMRSLTYVQPGQTLACIGCHEHRDLAPLAGGRAAAALREPSRLRPGPEGSWPLKFADLVQPVLDRQCVACHSAGAKDPAGARFDLTPARAYASLLAYANKDIERLAFEKDRSLAGDCVARQSKLWALLTAGKGHYDVKLDADARDRLATWLDTYAHRVGHYSDTQEEQLRELRGRLRGMME